MQNVDRYISGMKQAPYSRMTRFRLFWEALDAVMARRGMPPLDFAQASDWFGLELSPDDIADIITTAQGKTWDDHYFEERLTREAGQ